MLTHLLEQFWQLSWQAGAVAIFVLLLRAVFARALSPRWRHLLWFLVLGRLLIPVLPESRFSLFNAETLFDNHKPALVAVPESSGIQTTTVRIVYGSNPIATPISVRTEIPEKTVPFWRNPAVVASVWIAVAMSILLRLLIANLRFAFQLRHDSQKTPAHLDALLKSCQHEMNLARCPALLITNAVDSPAVVGMLGPRVLLSASSAATLSTAQIRLIFLHELAHIKSHDVALDWIWAVLQAMHWFNPILWLITPIRQADRELARDEMVLGITGPQESTLYGKTLLQLSQAARLPLWCPGLVGIVGGKHRLRRRIKMIASYDGNNLATGRIGLALLIIAGCCAMTNPSSGEPPTTSPVVADKPTTAPAAEDEVQTLKYDVNDLSFVPWDGDNSKPAPTDSERKQTADQDHARRMADLKTYVEENVATSTWKDQGGDLGTISLSPLRGVLLVRQTRQNHLEIQRALDKLRESQGLQISIEIRFILIDDDTAQKMSADVRHRLAALAGAGRHRTDQILNADEVRQLMRAVQVHISTTSLTAPRLTFFDGQHVILNVETPQSYVDSMSTGTAIERGKSVMTYQPHTATAIASGVELHCAACVSPDHGSVFVDLQPKLSKLLALESEHWSRAPANADATIQRAITVTYERSLACAIPNKQTLLLSGFTQTIHDSDSSSTTQAALSASAQRSIDQERHRQYYLLVCPKILMIDNKAEKFPLLPTPATLKLQNEGAKSPPG